MCLPISFCVHQTVRAMHPPRHAPVLPDAIDPIPMPDTPREAELLVMLLDMGLYPKAPSDGNRRPKEE